MDATVAKQPPGCAAGNGPIWTAQLDIGALFGRISGSNSRELCVVQVDWDKGTALSHLLKALGEDSDDDVLPIYLGDDRTDEDAFRVLSTQRPYGLGILVASKARWAVGNNRPSRFLGHACIGNGQPRYTLCQYCTLGNRKSQVQILSPVLYPMSLYTLHPMPTHLPAWKAHLVVLQLLFRQQRPPQACILALVARVSSQR
jgi:Trehalose-phosphatase